MECMHWDYKFAYWCHHSTGGEEIDGVSQKGHRYVLVTTFATQPLLAIQGVFQVGYNGFGDVFCNPIKRATKNFGIAYDKVREQVFCLERLKFDVI